jgi:hypothetical protein
MSSAQAEFSERALAAQVQVQVQSVVDCCLSSDLMTSVYLLFDDGELVWTKAGEGVFMRRTLHVVMGGDALGRQACRISADLAPTFPYELNGHRYMVLPDSGEAGRAAAVQLRSELMRLITSTSARTERPADHAPEAIHRAFDMLEEYQGELSGSYPWVVSNYRAMMCQLIASFMDSATREGVQRAFEKLREKLTDARLRADHLRVLCLEDLEMSLAS